MNCFSPMSANGYLDIEPLIVMQDPNSDCLIVLEGNRRLAALRLLREADPINRMWTSKEIRIRVPPVDDLLCSTFHHVSVYAVDSRQRAPLVHRIQAHQRSCQVGRICQGQVRRRLVQVGTAARQSGGDRRLHRRSPRHDQAHGVSDLRSGASRERRACLTLTIAIPGSSTSPTSTLRYRALNTWTISASGETWARYDPAPDPVPVERLDELRKMLVWIYGSKSTDELSVVRSQNPDIKNLGEVLAHTEARHLLKTTHNLDQAHETTEGIDKKFTGSLFRARDAVRDASASLRAYDGRDKSLLDVAEDIKVQLDSVHASMERTYRRANVPE